jgi:hypothetical protein
MGVVPATGELDAHPRRGHEVAHPVCVSSVHRVQPHHIAVDRTAREWMVRGVPVRRPWVSSSTHQGANPASRRTGGLTIRQ